MFLSQAMVMGVSTSVNAVSARRKGEGRTKEVALPLNAGLVLVLLFSPLITAVLFMSIPSFYPYLNPDPEVQRLGVPYLEARILGITFVGINFAFRGYWSAVDMPRIYMRTLVLMHAANIFLNWLLIFGNWGMPELGAQGAGVATFVSTAFGSLLYFAQALRLASKNGFLRGLPSWEVFRTLVQFSLSNGIQQSFFSGGLTAMYVIIGQIGTSELAAANVLINVMLVAILPGIGMGIAASTLVSQALGRGDHQDAYRWGMDVLKLGVLGLFLLGLPMWVVPDGVLTLFVHDSATVDLARLPMRISGLSIAVEAVGLVLMNSLLGAGDHRRVMLVSVASQWIIFLPAAYWVGPVLGFGLLGIWVLQVIYRSFQAGVYSYLWKDGRWTAIRV